MEKLIYNWISEGYSKRVCVKMDRLCLTKRCPAWCGRGDGLGRCLFVPGYRMSELDPDPEDE